MSVFNISKMFNGVDSQWIKIFTSDKLMPLLSKVFNDLSSDKDIDNITPKICDIFNFARLTPYGKVKVVIVGQDPYPKKGDAHGLAFSSLSKKVPASLLNIYKCLEHNKLISTESLNITTSDLTCWASQGVLLLNRSLTTIIGKPNAHSIIWCKFIDELIKVISYDKNITPCYSLIFLLWGNKAQELVKKINEDCIVFEWSHPSPLAVANNKAFITCDHFNKVNAELVNTMEEEPIDWNIKQDVKNKISLPAVSYIFTDGACSNNGKGPLAVAGYSTYFTSGSIIDNSDEFVIYGKLPPTIVNGEMVYGTNQRAEGVGIIVALEEIVKRLSVDIELPAKPAKAHTFVIITDSEFWINMIEKFMPSWYSKGINFTDKKNSDLTIRMYDAIKNIEQNNNLKFIHVASHGKNANAIEEHVRGNKIADEYAVMGKLLNSHIPLKCVL